MEKPLHIECVLVCVASHAVHVAHIVGICDTLTHPIALSFLAATFLLYDP